MVRSGYKEADYEDGLSGLRRGGGEKAGTSGPVDRNCEIKKHIRPRLLIKRLKYCTNVKVNFYFYFLNSILLWG